MGGLTGCFSKWFLTDFLHCFHVGNWQESGSRYEGQGHWWDPRTWPQAYMSERQVTPSNKIKQSLQIHVLNVSLKEYISSCTVNLMCRMLIELWWLNGVCLIEKRCLLRRPGKLNIIVIFNINIRIYYMVNSVSGQDGTILSARNYLLTLIF